MQPGDHLVDNRGDETPYRVERLVASGEDHQIAEATDTERDRPVALRSVLYGEEPTGETIEALRTRLETEWHFLETMADEGFVPAPVEWIEVDASPVDRPPEPVIVCEKIEGPTLFEHVTQTHPEGVDPEEALEWIDELAEFAGRCHRHSWLWRDFDPRNFRLDDEDRLRAVSIGAVVARTGHPAVDEFPGINPDYTAPEVRQNLADQRKQPAADLYGIGALGSFMLTGQQPRHRVESPLSYTAHQRIRECELPGLELLVARLLQPMAKGRLQSADQLREYCAIEELPTVDDPGFEDCELPAPWEGLDIDNPDQNRGLQSQISSGPLVSMSGEEADDRGVETGVDWRWVVGISAVILAVILAINLTG